MTYNNTPAEGRCFVYQVHLPLSTGTLRLVVAAIGAYRAQVKSRWRKLPDVDCALIVLAVLRHDSARTTWRSPTRSPGTACAAGSPK